MSADPNNILVIKLGALGDFIQALGPMAAIRTKHPKAQITLLTTKPFEELAQRCGYFDQIWIDKKPKFMNIGGWAMLRKRLRSGQFDRVYDLQNNDRTSFYFKLFPSGKKPEWSGVAKGASHRNISPARTAGHAFDGHKQTLALAGITDIEIDDLSWLDEDLSSFDLKPPYILFVPGCAPQHPYKRWPPQHYGALAQKLMQQGYQILLLGTQSEKEIIAEITGICPQAVNLAGRTTLFQIAALARSAAGAIGNDTGPMHMIAATACPSLVLFSGHSNPKRHAPQGAYVSVLQETELGLLEPDIVLNKFTYSEI